MGKPIIDMINKEIENIDKQLDIVKGKIHKHAKDSNDLNSQKASYIFQEAYLNGSKNTFKWIAPYLMKLEKQDIKD